MEKFQHFAVQQTTPSELATFLVLVTVGCVLLAGLIYMGIMTIAWAVSLRGRHGWRQVVFPNWPRLKRLKWEYALAVFTSVVLTLTLAEKDHVVDAVLKLDARDVIDKPLVASLFPVDSVPSTIASGRTSSFGDEVKRIPGLKLAALVQGPLKAGREGEMRSLILAEVKGVLAREPAIRAKLPTVLMWVCVALLIAYLAWLTSRRISALKLTADNVESPYQDVARRLVVLGVCLALLLATPVFAHDAEQLADSTIAVARHAPPAREVRRLDSLVAAGMKRQRDFLTAGRRGTDPAVRDAITGIAVRLNASDSVARQVATLRAMVELLRSRVDGMPDASASLRAIGNRLDVVEKDVSALKNRALLLVETDAGVSFQVSASASGAAPRGGAARVVDKGATLGLFSLPPGTYDIAVGPTGQTRRVILAAGQVRAEAILRGR